MKGKVKFAVFILFLAGVALFATYFLSKDSAYVLHPKGIVAMQERNLIMTATGIMLLIVVPVVLLVFFFAWKYRASNSKEKYMPDWEASLKTQFIWWLLPTLIIFTLAVINWQSTHALDPFKPITSNTKPVTIQAVALRWKWLFIYPEQNIATVNFIEFPKDTPISFELTADDTPMSSFWIPQLGGQMYAMSGMSTQLHLMASEVGEFRGGAAEINGAGFADMKFMANSVSQADFDAWVALTKTSAKVLTKDEYNTLLEPTENTGTTTYAAFENGLYTTIVNKTMAPETEMSGMKM